MQTKTFKRYKMNSYRKVGIDVIGEAPWGTHFCQFYKTKEDLLDTLIPYFEEGLKNNEMGVLISSDFLNKDEIIEEMKKNIPQFAEYLEKGQMEIFPYTEWYLEGGSFDFQRVLNMWLEKCNEAVKKGYDGLRVSGNPYWIDNKKNWNDFTDYESKIDSAIKEYNLLVMCTYSLDKCDSSEIVDVLKNHQFAMIKRSGNWELVEGSAIKMENKIRQVSEEWQRTFDHASDSIFVQDKDFTIIKANKMTFEMLKLSKERVVGKKCFEVFHKSDRPCPNCPFEKTRMDKKPHTEEIYELNIGADLLVTTSPIFGEKGEFMGSVHVAKDVTERKKIEKEISRLASFPERNPHPVMETDIDGNILYQNPTTKELFPGLQSKANSHPWLSDWNHVKENFLEKKVEKIIREVAVNKSYFQQTIHYLKEQNRVRIYGVDVTGLKEKEQSMERLNRTLRALSKSNQLLMRATDELTYLTDICQIISRDCGYRLVWIGYTQDDEQKSIKPIASAGFEEGHLETHNFTWSGINDQTPAGNTIRTGETTLCQNILTDFRMSPWREEALNHGYASCIVFPMKDGEKTFGVVNIYSDLPNPFLEEEIKLLNELVGDITYGIISLRIKQARQKAEEELQKSETKLHTERNILNAVMNNSGAGLAYIDRNFNFVSVNSIYCKTYGRAEEELLGKNYFDFFPSEENRLLFEKSINAGQQIGLNQKPLVFKNQPWREVTYWDWTLTPVKNNEDYVYGLVISLVDVSERVKSIENLKMHGRELEQLTSELKKVQTAVENASDIIFITDEKGKIIYINRAVKNILGFKQKELIGKKPNFWMEEMPNKFFSQMWQAIYFDKNPFVGEIQDRKKDGEIFTAEIRIAPVLDKNGHILSFVGIERDITEAKRLDLAKTEFISLAAHQLRTPITTVSLTAEMFLGGLSGKMGKESEEYLNNIIEGIKKMSEMIDLFLNVSRMEMKTFEIIPRPSNIAQLIESNIKNILPQIQKKGIELKKNISEDLPIIDVDSKVIDIALDNLLSNAVKYTPGRGLITVEAEKYRDAVVIKVSDTGCGIPKKQQARVFEKLFRGENASQKVEGTGLGLYLCKSLIEQAGGKIWLKSELDKGSIFYVSLPLTGMKKNKRTPRQ